MTTDTAVELIGTIAWPLVALLALIYIWRSDAIGKLINIAKAIDDLKTTLRDVVEAEEAMRRTSGGFTELAGLIKEYQSDLVSIKLDVEGIRDRVGTQQEASPAIAAADVSTPDLQEVFANMDREWRKLVDALIQKFGWIDGRMIGSEAYRLAHGNRKGLKLTYDQAEEIGRLHSEIKSYRRRQSELASWLTPEIAHDFSDAVGVTLRQIEAI